MIQSKASGMHCAWILQGLLIDVLKAKESDGEELLHEKDFMCWLPCLIRSLLSDFEWP